MSFSGAHGAKRARGAKLTILRLGIVAPAIAVQERFPILFPICGGEGARGMMDEMLVGAMHASLVGIIGQRCAIRKRGGYAEKKTHRPANCGTAAP